VKEDVLLVMSNNLDAMRKSISWLRRSYQKCVKIGVRERYSEEEFDAFENLAGRFARTIDLIVSKALRSIDSVELEETGTMIDTINRAEKRGIVSSTDRVRDLKDLRNDIVHEYETDDLRSLFAKVLELTPEVFSLAEKTENYCKKYTTS
jgi:uncharacterized protein YutE (UPF0331/DUF86 family)